MTVHASCKRIVAAEDWRRLPEDPQIIRLKAVFDYLSTYPCFYTLTASAILGQTRLPLLNPQIPTFKRQMCILQPKQTVLFPFTRWQHVYYILETRQAALVRRWSGDLCCGMRDVYTHLSRLH